MKSVKLLLLLLPALGVYFSGCGEKIAIPEPKGLFSIRAYLDAASYPVEDPRQLVLVEGGLFLIHGNSLSKRDQSMVLVEGVEPVTGFGDPLALCSDPELHLVFVYDQSDSSVSWYSTSGLEFQGNTRLPLVHTAVSMITSSAGIEQVPDAQTFLYLADPDSSVVHRYVFDEISGLSPFGILARSDGQSARFVHQAAGLARDPMGDLLVCDADSGRNWVIHFSSSPDMDDTTVDPDDQDPLRGLAIPFRQLNCVPQPTAAFVLGDAPECGETSWEGAPSAEEGEFDSPLGVASDGNGRVYVSDTGNNRIQVFTEGEFELRFTINADGVSRPTSLAVLDKVINPFLTHWGAYVFIVLPEEGLVRKFISYEEAQYQNPGTPPPPLR